MQDEMRSLKVLAERLDDIAKDVHDLRLRQKMMAMGWEMVGHPCKTCATTGYGDEPDGAIWEKDGERQCHRECYGTEVAGWADD